MPTLEEEVAKKKKNSAIQRLRLISIVPEGLSDLVLSLPSFSWATCYSLTVPKDI